MLGVISIVDTNIESDENDCRSESLTKNMEDYLETIFLLQKSQRKVRVSDIAGSLSVAKSSVHIALHNLSEKGYIIHEKYKTPSLTEKGIKEANQIYERHKNLKDFFLTILKLDSDTAEKDACAAEHILSREAIGAMTLLAKNTKL